MLQTCNVVLLTFIADFDVYQPCYGSALFHKLDYDCGYDKANYKGCGLGICTSRTFNPYHLPRACGLTEIKTAHKCIPICLVALAIND